MPEANGRSYEVAGVQFADEGISISYMVLPDDVRLSGALFAQHTLNIAEAHPNFTDEIDQIRTQLTVLLREALDDFAESDPVEPDDDEDDERGMGE